MSRRIWGFDDDGPGMKGVSGRGTAFSAGVFQARMSAGLGYPLVLCKHVMQIMFSSSALAIVCL